MRIILALLIIGCMATDMQHKIVKQMIVERILQLENVQERDAASVCSACQVGIRKVRGFSEKQLTNFIDKEFSNICPLLKDKNFCDGISQTFIQQFSYHFFEHIYEPQNACASLDVCEYTYTKQSLSSYINEVLSDKLTSQQLIEWNKIALENTKNTKPFNVVQLADLHIDVEYKVGAQAFCKDPFCCREENGLTDDVTQQAQYWGTHAQCDLPVRTIENMVEFIASDIKPDFIIWTGDSTSHDVWHQQQFNQTLPTKIITQKLQSLLPTTQVYAIFGNHEAYPADQYDVVGQNSQWLRDETSDMWRSYLDDQAHDSLRSNGYYAQVDQERNLRVIALNTQACDSLNFYLYDHITDPSNELAWLKAQLQLAEQKHQYAIIFAHIPPGDTFCHSQWAERFSVIVERFQHVLKGLFYGHTHQDHVQHIRSKVDGKYLATAFIAPSGTTYSYQNPSFRVIHFNQHNEVIDYSQYRLNLDKANKDGPTAKLDWHVAYTFLKEYGLKSAKIEDLQHISDIIQKDKNLLNKYVYNFYAGSEKIYAEKQKDLNSLVYAKSTKKFYVCGSESAVFDDWYTCVGMLEKTKDFNFLTFKLLDSLAGKWRQDDYNNIVIME
ncbi:hypothetical protein pb186bvf_013487 [Paramecium bursaria]